MIKIETGIDNPDILDEFYDRFIHNDEENLINDYFDELIYDLEYEITVGKEKDIESVELPNKYNELFDKMDNFVEAYTDLSNIIFDIDYDFADDYPLEKSFHDIDFMSWVEATKIYLSKEEKGIGKEKINTITNAIGNKKESTITKLKKLKDKVSQDTIEKLQENMGVKKNDREI